MIDKGMSSACIQGGSVHSLNMYPSSGMLEARSPNTPSWPYAASQVVKQEPMEEDKNDSGINSGSDFHSSSPGSDHSNDLNAFSPHHHHQTPNSTRFMPPMIPTTVYNFNSAYMHPLTPPISEPLVSPKCEEKEETTLTPCSSPNEHQQAKSGDEDHLRRLEMTLEKSGLFSSKVSEKSMDDSSVKSDNEPDEFDEQGLRVPKMNSHGKVKTFKCKQCEFVAITKLEYWDHTKTHIREEKRLTCPKCPFITEYKHHLEYHLRNHTGSKPFKCNKCEYSCVNKSMLNSHMKSHSNIYRYSCRDCSYATKYCHSLKIHLRRYAHQPNIVLDEDGNPCPDLIIDVHGTRRGPKIKQVKDKSDEASVSSMSPPQMPIKLDQSSLPFGLNLMGSPSSGQHPHMPFSGYPFFPNPQLLQNFQQLIRERQALANFGLSEETDDEPKEDVLDLSKANNGEQKSRRKGPAYKLDHMARNRESDEEEEEEEEEVEDEEEFGEDDDMTTTTMFSNVEVVQKEDDKKDSEVIASTTSATNNNNNVTKGEENTCQYCNINFGDAVLYTMHMGYHGFKNPFACNMCGVECADKVSFFLHIARTPHT